MLRYDREEALAAVASEYARLGRPLDGVSLTPSEGGDGGEPVIYYTVNFTTDDGWTLNAYEGNILQASTPLPEPESSWGFWKSSSRTGGDEAAL